VVQAWVFSLVGWDVITDPLPEMSSFSPEEARQALLEAGYFAEAVWYSPEAAWHGTGSRLSIALYSADPTTLQQPPFPFLVRLGTAFRTWPVYMRDLPSALELIGRVSVLLQPARAQQEQHPTRQSVNTELQRELAHTQELLTEVRRQRDQLERQVETLRAQLYGLPPERTGPKEIR
jgi:hypothetical protein